jgi:hypothetical protein
MSKLTGEERKNLKTSTFADPSQRKYPIPDISHARDALSRVSANGSSKLKAMVRAEVHRRFPSIKESKK